MDKVHYLIMLLYLITIINKTNVKTSIIKNVFYFEYHISRVKNMDKVHSLIMSLYLVSVIKNTNVQTSMIKIVLSFEYHL